MPKITEVSPQKKSANRRTKRFNVFIDGVFAFGADEDLVVEYRLVPGKVLQPQGLEQLLFESGVGKLMERIYRLFEVRARSEKEIRDYLRRLSFRKKIKSGEEISDLVRERLIEKLRQKGMINDLEFAKAWVEARSKKKGFQLIKAELIRKGVSREVIEDVVSSRLFEVRQEDVAENQLHRRLARWSTLSYQERKKKAYEFLLRRGFEYEVIKEVVEKNLKKE